MVFCAPIQRRGKLGARDGYSTCRFTCAANLDSVDSVLGARAHVLWGDG